MSITLTIFRDTANLNEVSREAQLLRNQATVIALSRAYTDAQILQTVAKPDHIINANLNEMIESVVRITCPKALSIRKYSIAFTFSFHLFVCFLVLFFLAI